MEEIIIEKINYKELIISISLMLMLIAAVAVTIYGFDKDKMRYWLGGIFAIMGLLAAFIKSVANAMHVGRLLTITRDGIIDSSSMSGIGYVAFDDIKDFAIITLYNKKAIAIVPKNTDCFLTKLNVVKRKIAKKNINLNLPPVMIPTHMAKDMEPEDILTLLKKRLTDYSSLYD